MRAPGGWTADREQRLRHLHTPRYLDFLAGAWDEWLAHQTMLINEKRLNLMDMTARTYLNEQRDRFLSGAAYDSAEGYVPKPD